MSTRIRTVDCVFDIKDSVSEIPPCINALGIFQADQSLILMRWL